MECIDCNCFNEPTGDVWSESIVIVSMDPLVMCGVDCNCFNGPTGDVWSVSIVIVSMNPLVMCGVNRL